MAQGEFVMFGFFGWLRDVFSADNKPLPSPSEPNLTLSSPPIAKKDDKDEKLDVGEEKPRIDIQEEDESPPTLIPSAKDKNGRNVVFVDSMTGEEILIDDAIKRVKAGKYPRLQVVKKNKRTGT